MKRCYSLKRIRYKIANMPLNVHTQREVAYDDFAGIQQGLGFNRVRNPLDE
jgi:hypothetical protein